MKKNLLLLVLVLPFSFSLYAQRELIDLIQLPSEEPIIWINGPQTVDLNDVDDYYVNIANGTINSVSYFVNGGYVISSSNSSVRVKWTIEGLGRYIRADVYTSAGLLSEYIYVDVIANYPGTPNPISISSNSCGNKTLTRLDPPPNSGITWYWQTSYTGTSMSNSSKSIQLSSSGTRHLRAYNSNNGLWSIESRSSGHVHVTQYPNDGYTVSGGGNTCTSNSPVMLSGSEPGVRYQLRRNGQSVGSSQPGTGYPINFGVQSVTGTYDVRATRYSVSASCGRTMGGNAVVSTVPPSIPNASVSTNTCGPKTITVSDGPNGTIAYWQTSSTGESQTDDDFIRAITSSGTYYLRAFNGTCWSDARVFNITINDTPSIPDPISVSTNVCGDKTLTRSNPPEDVKWYWQGTDSEGTSATDDSMNYTVNDNEIYYLRAYSTIGCGWSDSRAVSVTVNYAPSIPEPITVSSNICGDKVLTRDNPPSNVTWYWQGTNPNGTLTTNELADYTVSSTGIYYLRALSDLGCGWSSSSRAVDVTVIQNPSTFQVSGGGLIWEAIESVDIDLNGSQPGVEYHLYLDGSPTGLTAPGDGNPISFSNVTAEGTYTIRAYSSPDCFEEMDDFATVTFKKPFITTWKTDDPNGATDDNQILIPTTGSGYDYHVRWENVNDPSMSGILGPFTGDALIDFPNPGTYQVIIARDFPRIYFNNSGDKTKLRSVDQWGISNWTSFEAAFSGCENFNILASDAPDLSNVTSLKLAFFNAERLNADINNWDVASITDMSSAFADAYIFNSDLSSWDVSGATTMAAMFRGASQFNRDISSWDVSNVQNMSWMFSRAQVFNSDISNWNVSNVQDMSNMFSNTFTFNVDIGNWNVSSVTNMYRMFTDNQRFNQDLSLWNVSNVTTMEDMFWDAASFDQSLGDWDISGLTEDMGNMLRNVGMSTESYDATLIGWNNVSGRAHYLRADGLLYCNGQTAREALDSKGWRITGDFYRCRKPLTSPFVMIWDTRSGTPSNDIIIPVDPNHPYEVAWTNLDDPTISGSRVQSGPEPIFVTPGRYRVEILDSIPRIKFGSTTENRELVSIEQWGDNKWNTMEAAFANCIDLLVLTSDVPDLSKVKSTKSMFQRVRGQFSNFENWNTEAVEDMSLMFSGASTFNEDISNWNVGNVKNMSGMFSLAYTFNQDIGNWNVENVEIMKNMFNYAREFNQDIGSWNVEKVQDMERMFHSADEFNQDISNWNTSKVKTMSAMFENATDFDQNLGDWDLSSIENHLVRMLWGTSLSTSNYDAILAGWSTLNTAAGETSIPMGIGLLADGLTYCNGELARTVLEQTYGWSITGDALSCTPPSSDIVSEELESLVLSSQEEGFAGEITIYPNPSNQYININGLELASSTITIFNLQGKSVYTANSIGKPSETIDVSNIPDGTYILRITNSVGVEEKKLIIRH